MAIKQALLDQEIAKTKAFLAQNGLKYDADITQTLYYEEDGEIIATISRSNHIIKCLAVRKDRRGENLAGVILSELLSAMRLEGIYHYQVFTKTEYVGVFQNLGFQLLAATANVAILEAGEARIEEKIAAIRVNIAKKYGIASLDKSIGAIVVNCNPMTKGHYQLILEAAKNHDIMLVFVVEEDQSVFTYAERFAFVENALKTYPNIMVLPSTKYMVSQLTFPSYFLKTIDEAEYEHAMLDAILFRDHFMIPLNIQKRYIGGESEPVMVAYNKILKSTLGERIVLRDRFCLDKETISASLVRKLIFENKIAEAMKYIPEANHELFLEVAKRKYAESKR